MEPMEPPLDPPLYREGMVQFACESHLILAVDSISEVKEDVQQVRAAVEHIGRRGDNY